MTLTIANDCSQIEVTSTLITNYVAALPSPDHTLTLELKSYQGNVEGGEVISLTLDGDSLDTDNNKYVITPSDLSAITTIPDMVLSLKLTKTVTATGAKEIEYSCAYLDCETKCKLPKHYSKHPQSMAYAYHLILSNNDGQCSNCTCSEHGLLFVTLTKLLNETIKDEDCGC